MQGAVLWQAQLQGAVLWQAQLQGADLRRARLQGANLLGAQLDDLTNLSAATLRGAALRTVDDTAIAQLRPFWPDIFADVSVQVPEGQRPAHWADEELDLNEFIQQWRTWQATLPEGWDKPDRELGPEFFEAWERLTTP